MHLRGALILFLTVRMSTTHNAKDDIGNGPDGAKQGQGRFAFASYYSDHMVLQQAPRRAVIWGYYPVVGYRIMVEAADDVYFDYVEPGPTPEEGVWSVTLNPVSVGGPYTISAYGENGLTISISDVMFGDVWVCSGQSNMQFTVSQIFNASEELEAASNYTQIRIFTVGLHLSPSPLIDLAEVEETWSLPNSTTLGGGAFKYFSAVCWLFGKLLYEELQYPIGLIDTSFGGTPVEAWSSPDALTTCGLSHNSYGSGIHKLEVKPGTPSVLWNAMIYPLLQMTILGAIWYQGESDSSEPMMHRYNCTFPAMIDDWRAKFSSQTGQTDPLFPFGFVQLAPENPTDIRVGFPDIRWHQTADYGYVPNPRMENVFMSVAIDLPDFNSTIHPRDKQDVAQRLVLSALGVAYSREPAVISGPLPMAVAQESQVITLDYGGLWVLRVNNTQGFELCCPQNATSNCSSLDSGWVTAPILFSSDVTIALDGAVCRAGTYVTAIRYAWRQSPFQFKDAAVYSVAYDLPAPPFISFKPPHAGTSFSYVFDWSKPTILP